eukprot:355677-Chlamydomonas_euryale.AAC.1
MFDFADAAKGGQARQRATGGPGPCRILEGGPVRTLQADTCIRLQGSDGARPTLRRRWDVAVVGQGASG